jgi:hypothetical protein
MEDTMKRALALLILAFAAAGCGTTSGLGTAADRLDSSARRFYDQVDSYRAPDHASQDAAALAEATHDFRRAVDSSRSREELQPSFDRVAERYHHLRKIVEERAPRSSDARLAFDRVTEAYLDVDRAMNYPSSAYRN